MPKDEFDPRRAAPGERFVFNDVGGDRVTGTADDDGVLHPRNEAEVRMADAFGLPVARKVLTEQKAATTAGKD